MSKLKLVALAVLAGSTLLLLPSLAQSCKRYRVSWLAYSSAPALVVPGSYPANNTFDLVGESAVPGDPQRRRSSDLAIDRLVVLGLNSSGQEVARDMLVDPRVFRDEASTSNPMEGGQVLHRSTVEFLVVLPDDPSIAKLRFVAPNWSGASFTLQTLGEVTVP